MTSKLSGVVIDNRELEFIHLLIQVFLVGMIIGLFRTVIPALAEERFQVPADAIILLGSFVMSFGLVKAVLNFVSGNLSDFVGRRKILIIGSMTALPIPWILAYTTDWFWIVAATVLLGINQGFCWSMTQVMKLDISKSEYHGTAVGFNETLGYCGVALAGYLSAELTLLLGVNGGLLYLGLVTTGSLFLSVVLFGKETKAQHEKWTRKSEGIHLFIEVSWKKPVMSALCFAGMVEKFVDTLVWLIYPFFLYQQGISLRDIGIITAVYGTVWGLSQLLTGPWSDRGNQILIIVIGMILCALACTTTLWFMQLWWWVANAAIMGFGMAMLYPTLSAAVSVRCIDIRSRGTVMGIYRFWRDLGYFIGALALTITASVSGDIRSSFWLTTAAMLISAIWVWAQVSVTEKS